jgi:hypothetical protein
VQEQASAKREPVLPALEPRAFRLSASEPRVSRLSASEPEPVLQASVQAQLPVLPLASAKEQEREQVSLVLPQASVLEPEPVWPQLSLLPRLSVRPRVLAAGFA